jgi:hypothetical protein
MVHYKAYSSGFIGETISYIYNALSNEISFEKNGVSIGMAFTNISGENRAPAVELNDEGDSITLS